MKKKVFITGISSEILKNLIPLVNFEEYEIIGLSRKPDNINIDNVTLIDGDLSDIKKIENVLKGCFMVIHAAAVTHSFKVDPYYRINFKYTQDLIKIASKFNINRFILLSSYASGPKSGAYGRSKYLAEQFLQENFNNWTIFRLAEVYGSRKIEGIDKLINSGFSNSIHLCPVQISQELRPIYLLEASRLLKEYIFDKSIGQKKLNIVGNANYSIKDILKIIGKIKNKTQYLILIPKLVMNLIYHVSRSIPFSLGLNPDQIKRLYRPNYQQAEDLEIQGKLKLVTYLKTYGKF
ncbi:hypothetical protein GCM10023115_48230 [Pontixanthobacter gangjinensis]|uniref:NAD-dependent epimerase/dehydratase family protein n=1 Tax=Christiangramia aestuarii TaxID=1028746 RepID=A0A7M3SWV4_9FLAO|nr:NAD-dependent epimerase/dehydratase family protein [Christiangramia aestuarii]MUP41085.1 NAD-dependent epimerase/dehydratase family protein [Christiangramia aestuarii]